MIRSPARTVNVNREFTFTEIINETFRIIEQRIAKKMLGIEHEDHPANGARLLR
jgi:hypothetical protein